MSQPEATQVVLAQLDSADAYFHDARNLLRRIQTIEQEAEFEVEVWHALSKAAQALRRAMKATHALGAETEHEATLATGGGPALRQAVAS